jgi:death-on-curing protein
VNEPKWVSLRAVILLQSKLIEEFGGSYGIRDKSLIESALARPIDLFHYEKASIIRLAAAYAFGLCKNHGFIDGNKRIAIVAMRVFLRRNQVDFISTEAEATKAFQELASGELTEEAFSRWLTKNVQDSTTAAS